MQGSRRHIIKGNAELITSRDKATTCPEAKLLYIHVSTHSMALPSPAPRGTCFTLKCCMRQEFAPLALPILQALGRLRAAGVGRSESSVSSACHVTRNPRVCLRLRSRGGRLCPYTTKQNASSGVCGLSGAQTAPDPRTGSSFHTRTPLDNSRVQTGSSHELPRRA